MSADSVFHWIKCSWQTLNSALPLLSGTWFVIVASLVGIYHLPHDYAVYLIFIFAPFWLMGMIVFIDQVSSNKPLASTLFKDKLFKRLHHLVIVSILGLVIFFILSLLTAFVSSYVKYISGDQITGKFVYYAMAVSAASHLILSFTILITIYALKLVSLNGKNAFRAFGRAFMGAFKNFFKLLAMLLFIGVLALIALIPIVLDSYMGGIPMAWVSSAIGGTMVSLFGLLLVYYSSESIFPQPELFSAQKEVIEGEDPNPETIDSSIADDPLTSEAMTSTSEPLKKD